MTIKKKMLQAAAGFGVDVAGPIGVDFDGTNDYLSRSSDLVGNADGKTFTFSAWVYGLDKSGIYANTNSAETAENLVVTYDQSVVLVARNSAGTDLIGFTTPAGSVPAHTWSHIVISCDTANASNRYVYVNDKPVTVSWNTYVDGVINFTDAKHLLGATRQGSFKMDGRLAGVYLDYTYRDLSVEANRRDFIDADGLYVTPPTTGIISVPMDDPADPGRNDGTGGDFTLNGTVARSGRGPNQYNALASVFDGTNDYLSLAGSGGDDTTYEATFSCTFSTNSLTTRQFLTFARDGSYDEGVTVYLDDDGTLKIQYYPSSGGGTGGVFHHDISSHPLSINRNYYLSISFDTRDSSKRHVFLDGVALAGTWSQYDSDLIDHDTDFLYIGSDNGTQRLNGVMGEVYKDNSYIDLATENPFYDVETNKPKYLGESGELPTGSSPLIYLPLRADDAGNNLGTGGDFTVNSGPFAGARGASEFLARSAEFDGSTGYLSRAGLTGAADSKQLSMAFSVKRNAAAACYVISTDPQIAMAVQNNEITVFGNNSSASTILLSQSTISDFQGSWINILYSVDLTDTGKRNVYLNGISVSTTYAIYTDDNLNFASADYEVGRQATTNSTYANADIGVLYFNNTYIDFSQEANRLKFVDAFGYPVDLQPAIDAGDIPTPLIHMKFDDTSALGTNSGSGGDFTVNGTVASGADVKG
jgi:hypothetical protein